MTLIGARMYRDSLRSKTFASQGRRKYVRDIPPLAFLRVAILLILTESFVMMDMLFYKVSFLYDDLAGKLSFNSQLRIDIFV